MKKIIEKHFCDICGEEGFVWNINYPVIFHTEQTEGRSCDPYISQEEMEVCDTCLRKVLKIQGWGAQGFNKYKVREE